MNFIMVNTMIPFLARGNIICRKILNSDAPSSLALSANDQGTSLKKLCKYKNAEPKPPHITNIPMYVFLRFALSISWKVDASAPKVGTTDATKIMV